MSTSYSVHQGSQTSSGVPGCGIVQLVIHGNKSILFPGFHACTACYSKVVCYDFSNNEGKQNKPEDNVNLDDYEELMSLAVKYVRTSRRTEFCQLSIAKSPLMSSTPGRSSCFYVGSTLQPLNQICMFRLEAFWDWLQSLYLPVRHLTDFRHPVKTITLRFNILFFIFPETCEPGLEIWAYQNF